MKAITKQSRRAQFLLAFIFFVTTGVLRAQGAAQCVNATTFWDMLMGQEEALPQTLEICPNTTIDLTSDPIIISGQIVVICGETGVSDNNCILDGGDTQVMIDGNESVIEFHGITFLNSKQISIEVATTGNNKVHFEDCIWQGHGGETVFFVGGVPNVTDVEIGAKEGDDLLVGNETNTTFVDETDGNFTNAGNASDELQLIGDGMVDSNSSFPVSGSTGLANETGGNFTDTGNSSTSPLLIEDGNSTLSSDALPADPEPIPPGIEQPGPPLIPEDLIDDPNRVDGLNDPSLVTSEPGRKRSHRSPSLGRLLQSSEGTSITIELCVFMDNNVDYAVIVGDGGSISISDCLFESNSATGSTISIQAGDLTLSNTEFNANDGPPTEVFIGMAAAVLSNEGNCGSETFECNGVYVEDDASLASCAIDFSDCAGECAAFELCVDANSTDAPETNETLTDVPEMNETLSELPEMNETLTDAPETNETIAPSLSPSLQIVECPTNGSLIGYVDMESIQIDLGQNISTFELCPESTIEGSLDLGISNATLSITCMDGSCIWIASRFHLRLQGEQFGFKASGITFQGSSEASIVLKYEAASVPNFLLEDCTWEGNTGLGVFKLEGSLISSERALSGGYPRQQGDDHHRHLQASLNDLKRCVFRSNVVEEVLYVENSPLNVTNCSFQANTAQGSMIAAFESSVRLSSTEFKNNTFDPGQGLVHIGHTSSIESEDLCGLKNEQRRSTNPRCEGLLVGGDDCTPLVECQIECISSWMNLLSALEQGQVDLVVCAKSVIEIPDDSPLRLEVNDISLQCGLSGRRSDGCVLMGGTDQVVIAADGVNLAGMTFVGSSRSSIRAEAKGAFATIKDCEFTGHFGITVVVVHSASKTFLEGVEQDDITFSSIDRLRPGNESMALEIDGCLIGDNKLALAPVLACDGSLVVSDSVFEGNEGEVGTIAAMFNSHLDLANSCFLGNKGSSLAQSIAATVLVDSTSNLVRNDLNYGIGNSVIRDECVDGISLQSEACIALSSRFCESSIFNNSNVGANYTACVDNLEAIAGAIAEGNGTSRIELCPLAVLDLASAEAAEFPFIINRSNITISCGADGSSLNDCRFVGGEEQVSIVGNVTNIVFEGLTFVGSTTSSVVIEGYSPFSVEFTDCVWEDAQGETIFAVTSTDPETYPPTASPTSEERTDDIFQEENGDSEVSLALAGFEVALKHSSFSNNSVSTSLIVNMGAALTVTSCSFAMNNAGESIVLTGSGSLNLESSCFEANIYDENQGLITNTESSSVQSSSNYAVSDNATERLGCDGIFQLLSESCNKFNETICLATSSLDCISDWQTLSASIDTARTLGKGAVFSLCDDTILKVDSFESILLDVDNTVIQCGSDGALENRCTISGGNVQVQANGDNVTLRGINMLNSSVAAIHASGDKSRTVYIENCVFSENKGRAAVISYNGNIRVRKRTNGRKSTQLDLPEESKPSMSISIKDSAFIDNNVEFAPLAILGGTLEVESTSFAGNRGFSSGIGAWFGSDIKLSPSSCFNNESSPSITIDDGSTFAGLDVKASENSTDCTGMITGGECLTINQGKECVADVIALPSRGCYDSWVDLASAITSSLIQERNEISFSVCNNTVLEVSDDVDENVTPIVINGSQVIVKCGERGSRDGDCLIRGGRSHFDIRGSGTTTFIGLTFEGASFASILAAGDSSSIATFEECTWRSCDGQSVMLINKQADPGADMYVEDLVDLGISSTPAMTVLVDKSSFENNDVTFAVIANIGGNLDLLETLMVNNRDSRFGVVATMEGGSVGLSFTCFTGNSALERGIIFLERDSTLSFNGNAFASDNTVSLHNCSGIFMETEGSCAKLGACEGECQPYESRTCRVTSFSVDSTVSPTSAPSLNPTTGEPTMAPSSQPTAGGGSNLGVLVAAIVVPILLIAIGLLGLFYMRRKRQVGSDRNKDPPDDEYENRLPAGDGSHSRSKTQDLDESDFEEVDLRAHPEPGYMAPLMGGHELFHDEHPALLDQQSKGSLHMARGTSSRSSMSKGSANDEDNEFVRIPRSIGKKQKSNDILSLREVPTTF